MKRLLADDVAEVKTKYKHGKKHKEKKSGAVEKPGAAGEERAEVRALHDDTTTACVGNKGGQKG